MGTEIERKFLVSQEAFPRVEATHQVALRQGYLSTAPGATVRVRLQNEQGYLTIKGKAKGFARPEFEYPIPREDAEALLTLCPGPLIEKWRHYAEYAGKVWEVDEFFGDNSGLIVAELELDSEDEHFERPSWLGEEVTLDPKYHNSRLAERPFRSWSVSEQGEALATPTKASPPGPASGRFLLVVELWVRTGQEAAFREYEDQVLALLPRYGLELRARVAHAAQALGDRAPFETHLIAVPHEAALAAFEADPVRQGLQSLRDQVLVRAEQRRGFEVP